MLIYLTHQIKTMNKLLLILLSFVFVSCTREEVLSQPQRPLRDSVYVKNAVFEVVYSEVLEQPKWLIYKSNIKDI